MSFKVVQMFLRGFALILMTLGFFYSSEGTNLYSTSHFLISGSYASYTFVIFGLMIEAGLGAYTEKFIEGFFLILGVLLNLMTSVLSFYEYYFIISPDVQTMDKGFVSIASIVLLLIDLIILYCLKQ